MLNTFPSPISSLLDARIDGHSLPAGLYTREDVFLADLDVFFSRHWIHVGLECDVPEAGDAVVIDIGSTSLILLRDDDNDIRVVRNVCRHRGARFWTPGQPSFPSWSAPTTNGPTSFRVSSVMPRIWGRTSTRVAGA